MTKKDYIFNLKNLIKNRVYFHSPKCYDGDIDFTKILSKGIDLSLPIFIMEKPFRKEIISAFLEAQKEVDFNLIIREKNKKILSKFRRCFILQKNEISSIEKLNINYKTNSNYELKIEENYLKIGEKNFEPNEEDFYLEDKAVCGNIFYNIKKFLLNGENYIIELTNTSNQKEKIKIFYHNNLDRGYYLFNTTKSGLKTTNLITNEISYFNTNIKDGYKYCSCIDGVESSTFSCLTIEKEINLNPFEKKIVFINYGDKEFCLKNFSEMNQYFVFSQNKNREIFNVKINAKNKFLERYFNDVLPNKIWRAWVDGRRDKESEDEYNKIRNEIILYDGKKRFFPVNSYEINEIKLFDGRNYKKIANHT